ncbi:hypothetical protein OG788_24905 [Streptomyces sp. NBC_00647]|uniref:hypothetical protein n=1 Tax=Streptomyces sp. NBC_00647 TaxID=2975796 RepID=UPI00324DF194
MDAFKGHGGWPTFHQVDRRLDQYGIDAVAVLGTLTPHLLTGWPDPTRRVPSPETELRLTIAGVAHCPGSADVVDAFVSLVKTMTNLETGWPNPTSRPTLRSPDAIKRVELAHSPRKELLRRAFLLAREEPWAVYSNSGALALPVWDEAQSNRTVDAHGIEGWELGVDRRVRAYREVQDIGDYWNRRSWQLADAQSLVPPPPPPSASELFTPRHVRYPGMEANTALLAVWLLQQTDGDTTRYESPDGFAQERDLPSGRLRGVLVYAQQHHWVEVLDTLSGTSVRLTVAGVEMAEELLRLRSSRRVRFDYLTSALVSVAMDTYPMCRLRVEDFLISPASWLHGDSLTVDEVLRAVEYLREKGLAAIDYGQGGPAVELSLTGLGIDCGTDDDVNVRNFMSNQPGFSIGTVNNYGGAPQIGMNNTQHNTFGSSAKELAEFAQQVLAAAHTIDLPEDQRTRLLQDAQSLADQAESGTPEPGRVRQLMVRVRDSLTQNATDAVVQGLLNAAQNWL